MDLLDVSGTIPAPKILDFRLALVDRLGAQRDATYIGKVVGAPAYMAPEQFEGAELSGAIDVFALGQILWEMLVGRPAFGRDYWQIAEQKRRVTNGLDLRREVRGVSESFKALL